MPAKTIDEVKDIANYKKILKADMNLALVKPQPFRLYEKFKFNNNKTGPLLVVGTWATPLLGAVLANATSRKAEGKLAMQGRDALEFQVTTGNAKPAEIQTALNFTGVPGVAAQQVAKLGADSRTEAEGVVATAKDKLDVEAAKDIKAKKEALNARLQAVAKQLTPEEQKALKTASDGIKAALEGDKLAAYKSIADAERLLSVVETRLGKEVGPDGSGGADQSVNEAFGEYATEQEKRNKKIDDAIKTERPVPKKLSDSAKLGDGTVKSVRDTLAAKMGARVEGQKWQDDQIKGVKEATAQLARQAELVGEIESLEKQKKDAEKTVAKSVKDIEKLEQEIGGLGEGEEKQRKVKRLEASKLSLPDEREEIAEAERKLNAARAEKVKVDKWVEDNDAEKVAGKHGSGRHGAQTGLEGQARRVATGGYGADQPGNESGTSRPMVDSQGAAINKIQWNKVNLEFETVDGKRTIKNREKVLKEIVIQVENHFQETIASSLFLGPEFEKEAVTRALAIVKNQCPWTEIEGDAGWIPLKRVAITLGKPAKAAGWGTGIKKRDGAAKKSMLEANQILENYRSGKIDQNKMLENLNAQLVTKPDGGGVALVPTCLVVLDRTAVDKPWINITQYPCDGATPGWDIKGKKVRLNDRSPEVNGPDCTGV